MMSRLVLRGLAFVSFLALAIPATAVLDGCGSSAKKQKGGGAKGDAAKSANQKIGGTASGDTSAAKDQGATYELVTCDSSDDGLGWCDSDTEAVFCSGGHFYVLDCTTISGDFCGDDGATIDCYASADF
jgi:hypothetical protein